MKKRISGFILMIMIIIASIPSLSSQAASSPAAPKVTIKTTSADNPKLTWEKINGATGYGIYRKGPSDTKYSRIATTKKLTYTDKKWSGDEGSTVKYYVKAYSKGADGTKNWGKQSSVKNWKIPSKSEKTPVKKITPTPTPVITKSVSSYMVWIPTNGGTKYHSKSSCSNMKNPAKVTVDEAKRKGFTPCSKCKP